MTPHTSLPFRFRPSYLSALVGLALAASAHGQLFSDDFESYNAGTSLNTSGPWGTVNRGTLDLFILDETTAAPFGTPNQYFDFNDNSASLGPGVFSPNISAASGALTTFSFDFNEPSTGGSTAFIFGYANESADINSGGSRLSMNLDDGLITGLSSIATTGSNSYSLDASYRVHVVFNDTASPANYDGGTIPSGEAHVWLQPYGGSLVFAGTRSAVNTQTAAYRVAFRSFNASLQQMLVDNVSLVEGVDLPDAAAPALVSTDPADNATGVPESTNLVATFDKPIVPGTGNITIKETVGNGTVAILDVTSASELSFNGSSLTIDLPSDLAANTSYYVLIEAGAVVNAWEIPFAGLSATTDWSFTTGTSVVVTLAADQRIEGRNEINAGAIGYYSGGAGGRVGIGGGTNAREDLNLVMSYTLPTLPVGTTVSSATFNFEITNYNNHSGADPALNVYLLDSIDPSSTGTAFFYHGPGDPNPNVKLVGATDLSLPKGTQVNYAPGEQDHSYVITGDALALLQSYYGVDHIPDRTTVYFRFNLDNLIKPEESGEGADLTGAVFDRYFVNTDPLESGLAVTGVAVGGGSAFDTWASGKGLDGTPGKENGSADDPEKDGKSNLYEFAFDGDPLSGADQGKVFLLTNDGGDDKLILTIAVRSGAPAFSGSPSPSSTVDGITYTVEGSTNLSDFTDPVSVIAPVTTGLPTPNAGYEYRSFSLNESTNLPDGGFLRTSVTK